MKYEKDDKIHMYTFGILQALIQNKSENQFHQVREAIGAAQRVKC